jgi:hypothetical protein
VQVGIVEGELQKLPVLVRQPLEDLLLLVLTFAPLFVDEDQNGHRQADDGHDVTQDLPDLTGVHAGTLPAAI